MPASGFGTGSAGTLDPKTGIYTYADGSTYQNPLINGHWGMDGGSTASLFGDAGQGFPSGNATFGGTPAMSSPAQSSNLGFGGATYGGGATQGAASSGNPYLTDQANSVYRMSNQNLMQNVMPQIRSGALANGQYGGSRQAIAEGIAAGNAQTGADAAVAGLLGGQYNTDQSNALQRQSMNNQFMLGLGNLGLGFQNSNNSYNLGLGQLGNAATAQNQNFYTQQRGQDLSQYALGGNLYGSGISGQLGLGQGQYGLGNTYLQAPITTLQTYANTLSPYTGINSAQINTSNAGGGATGALGGALMGGQLASNLGFGTGYGSGRAFGNGLDIFALNGAGAD